MGAGWRHQQRDDNNGHGRYHHNGHHSRHGHLMSSEAAAGVSITATDFSITATAVMTSLLASHASHTHPSSHLKNQMVSKSSSSLFPTIYIDILFLYMYSLCENINVQYFLWWIVHGNIILSNQSLLVFSFFFLVLKNFKQLRLQQKKPRLQVASSPQRRLC